MEVSTTEPGLQSYTSYFLDNMKGKKGVIYRQFSQNNWYIPVHCMILLIVPSNSHVLSLSCTLNVVINH
jgi:hypothetical protein